jgi:predicted N-acetyltransferase YhbS
MNRMEIRDARSDEREGILELTLSAYKEYAPLMPYWDYYKDDIVATLRDPNPADQMVAVQDGRIVGSALLFPAGTVFPSPVDVFTLAWPEVRLLAVDPAFRRQGIGAALMGECIHHARLWGARFVALHTNRIMTGAIRLYERMGFKPYAGLDFAVDGQVVVRGYRFDLEKGAGEERG